MCSGPLASMPCSGAAPRSGWAVDPFGHSSTMPYLLRRSNLTSMLIQRVHYVIKKHFAATHSLEFMWRQAWGKARWGGGVVAVRPPLGRGVDIRKKVLSQPLSFKR